MVHTQMDHAYGFTPRILPVLLSKKSALFQPYESKSIKAGWFGSFNMCLQWFIGYVIKCSGRWPSGIAPININVVSERPKQIGFEIFSHSYWTIVSIGGKFTTTVTLIGNNHGHWVVFHLPDHPLNTPWL